MAAYAQDFQSKSQGLLGYVQNQLSQVVGWSALPGQLNKIVASSAGYVWGFNVNGDFYMCKEPCDGTNWKQMTRPPGITGMPLDIAVDAQNVYVLYNATAAPQETAGPSPGIQTGQIEIGDVGMPPGHISVGNGSVIISASFLGPNAAAVASSITKGTVYSATIKDDKGVTATFPITSVGTNPSWQGPPWMYSYSGSGGDSASVAAKFAKSKTIALTLTGTPSTATGGITDLGCWNDKGDRALSGPPQQYGYSPKTCKDYALAHGTDTFALQNGGWCVIKKEGDDYKKYGKATGPCAELGSAWVNHVYQATQAPAAGPTTPLSFSIQPVDGSGTWSSAQSIPGTMPTNPEINITDQFIFVGNQGCSKPCTTASWVPISGPQGSGQSMGVSAASSGSTYIPVNNAGKIKVYAGTASGQGGWTEKAGLAGKIPVAVEADNQFMYAQDQGSGGIYRCGAPYTDSDSCKLTDTQGKTVAGNHTISVNPRSYQTYIAASSSGSVGNLYQRLDEGSANVGPLIDETKKYASGLDSDVNALGYATTAQAAALSAAQTREEAMAAIQQITDLDDKFKETRIKQGNMRSKIVNDNSVPLYTARLTALKVVAYTLIAVIILHIVLSFFLSPTIVMGISLGATLVGILLAYSYLGAGFKVSISSVK
jgi:hypothetical protein